MKVGEQLGPYEVMGSVGSGGMGEVYRVRDSRLDREVAVKVLPRDFTGDPERLARFEREARAASALNHPNICMIHDVGEHSGLRSRSSLAQGRFCGVHGRYPSALLLSLEFRPAWHARVPRSKC